MTKASDNAFPSLLITEGTEPSAPAAGKQRLYIDSTTHKLKRTDSSGTDVTIEAATSPTWASFTPTWTCSGTAPAIGNGTLAGRHCDIGSNLCIVKIRFIAGSTTTYGTGDFRFALPHTAVTGQGQQVLTGWILDSGTDNKLATGVIEDAGTYVAQTVPEGANVAAVTSPMTWANGDRLILQGPYEY